MHSLCKVFIFKFSKSKLENRKIKNVFLSGQGCNLLSPTINKELYNLFIYGKIHPQLH